MINWVKPLRVKSTSLDYYQVKSEGTCKQGERADLTGCTPASGDVKENGNPTAPKVEPTKISGKPPKIKKVRLYRAADDDMVVGSASFSTSREAAEAYLNNPGFGGGSLWKAKVEINEDELLDLSDVSHDDAIEKICDLTGLPNPGAIGIDEWVPRIADKLRDAGIEWVRVQESYPHESDTYIFVGGNDPEMEEVER